MSTSSNLLNHTPNSPAAELRVLCLYRVSSNGQLYHNEKNEADIPMQRLECRRFADMMGWKIVYELQEEGISGHKVRAEQRDQIQKVKELAKQKKFDIFLVFMFDRIGRIADETPFVVEWLINAGIRVWSIQEGEQKIESHTDRLTNYIRYWQADGESQKTSIRTATRLAQITEDGHYSGRGCPFGYKLVKKGRVNKKGMPLNDLEIDEEEAGIVRLVFHKYVNEGYGPQRTANYLREIGSRNRKGKNWHPGTIRGMLHNLTYTGILRCGEARSPLIPELQIIDPIMFQRAQEISLQRSGNYEETRSVPLNTRGRSLLAGNLFCGHCGSRLSITTNGKGRPRADGTDTIRIRYVCQTKTRTHGDCDGQTGYTVHLVDEPINQLILQLLRRLGGFSASDAVEKAYKQHVSEKRAITQRVQREAQKTEKDLQNLQNEILKALSGESAFDLAILNDMVKGLKAKREEQLAALNAAQTEENEERSFVQQMYGTFNQFVEWADVYESATMETKKMIASQLIKRVEVSAGYKFKVELALTAKQFLELTNPQILPENTTRGIYIS